MTGEDYIAGETTHYRVIKRHADDYISIDYPGITSYNEAIDGVVRQLRDNPLADGESLTIVREVAPNAAPRRYQAYDRAIARNVEYL